MKVFVPFVCDRDIIQTNGNRTSGTCGKDMKWSALGVRRSDVKSQEDQVRFLRPGIADLFLNNINTLGPIATTIT